MVRESAAASLGIADAIEMFPAALESAVTDAFDRVLGELEEVFERLILLADTPTAPGGGGGGEGGAAALQPAAPAAMAVMEPAAPLAPAIPEETQLILPPVEQPVVRARIADRRTASVRRFRRCCPRVCHKLPCWVWK